MSEKQKPLEWMQQQRTHLTACAVFLLTLSVYWSAPPSPQVTDSGFSMLASQSLIEHQTFALDNYALPRDEPVFREDHVWNGEHYNLEYVRGRLYYFFPPGSVVLSVPFVFVMNRLGISAVNSDGTYNHKGEIVIETTIAVILMAVLSVIWFYTSLLVLPVSWSVLLALAAAFGTQVWSTATRALWTHTWETLLFGGVVYLLLRTETKKRRLSPVLLASLLAWSYFVRPSSSIVIISVTFYILFYQRRLLVRYALTGAIWLALFILYSWYNFGTLLPSYYSAGRLRFTQFWIGLAGNLISPSRGTIVYVPVLLFVAYLCVRYRKPLLYRRMVWLSLSVIVGHLIVISGFMYWWGGHSYGARYTTEMMPWFFMLAVIAVRARLEANGEASLRPRALLGRWAELTAGLVLLCLSVFMQARGVYSYETWKWNLWTLDSPESQKQLWETGGFKELWSWRYPQFLAGLIEPPVPTNFPPPTERIDFSTAEADKYVWYGWSVQGEPFRWSEGRSAGVIFSLDKAEEIELQMKLMAHRVPGRLERQRVIFYLNGERVGQIEVRETAVYRVVLPKDGMRVQNHLVFEFPDAASPYSLGASDDIRPLAVGIYWMEFHTGGR